MKIANLLIIAADIAIFVILPYFWDRVPSEKRRTVQNLPSRMPSFSPITYAIYTPLYSFPILNFVLDCAKLSFFICVTW